MTDDYAYCVNPGGDGQTRVLRVLQDDVVYYDRQPVALAIADSFERATDAAATVKVRYRREPV